MPNWAPMIALVALLAIGSPFPFGLIHGPMGKPASAANYAGRYVAVVPDCQPDLAAKFAGIKSETPLEVMPLFAPPKGMAAGDGFEQAVGAGKSVLLINPRGYFVRRLSRDPRELADWLDGSSLVPGSVAPNPYLCLRPLPAPPTSPSLGSLVAFATALRNPPAAVMPKDAKGFLILFLSSHGAADGLYAERIARVQTRCSESGVATLGVFSNHDETPHDVATVGLRLGLPCALDTGCAFADAFRATLTPEVFLMDPAWKVTYTGAIDSSTWEEPGAVRYLEHALAALAARKAPKVAQSMPFGNQIRRL